MINYAVVDDKQVNRAMLVDKLKPSGDFDLVFEASNGEEFLSVMKTLNTLPDLVFMDIDMPVLNGIKTVETATHIYPEVKFIMLTVFDDEDNIFKAIYAGAVGYLLKDDSYLTIENYAREAMLYGGAPMSPSIARKTLKMLNKLVANTDANDYLSQRELDILQQMVEGIDYKHIGEKLFISPATVRTHINNIYKKLHVNNKTQAVTFAIKKGWFNLKS